MVLEPPMTNKGFFFNSEGRKLFVEGNLNTNIPQHDHLIVMLDSLFEEKIAAWRFNEILKNEMAKLYQCIGVDYYGTGDSSGDFHDFKFYYCFKDISTLIHYLQSSYHFKYVTLIAVRIGASIATRVATITPAVNCIVLIDPILSGKGFLLEMGKRKKIFEHFNPGCTRATGESDSQVHTDYMGYLLPEDFAKEVETMDVHIDELRDNEIFVYQSDNRSSDAQEISESLGATNTVTIKSLTYPQFWLGQSISNNLIKAICDDIKSNYKKRHP